jgi:hypothetical protein
MPQECLFAPLTGLELQSSRVEGSVLVIEARLSVNMAAATIEQVVGKRRGMLGAMAHSIEAELVSELRRDAASLPEAMNV